MEEIQKHIWTFYANVFYNNSNNIGLIKHTCNLITVINYLRFYQIEKLLDIVPNSAVKF